MAMLGVGFLAASIVNKPSQPLPVTSFEAKPANKNVANAAQRPSAEVVPATAIAADTKQAFVDQRLAVTKNLLLTAKPETISLQIQSVPTGQLSGQQSQDALLKLELEKLGQQLEMDNIYLYRMQQNGGVYTVILYGAYEQRADAMKAMRELPEQIKSNRPYLRTLAGVKKDIEQVQ